MNKSNKPSFSKLQVGVLLACFSMSAQATVWTTPINGGTMTFDDWGYTGPQGRTAMDFAPTGGAFDGAAQTQTVVTLDPDRLTPDANYDFYQDMLTPDLGLPPTYTDANQDGQVNFYHWGYTTAGGKTFNNMQIDADGDYFVNRSDMDFQRYETFDYQNEGAGATADGVYPTGIKFDPYALSDGRGWCGSVMVSQPGALEAMAGQITFDFGFEAFLPFTPPGDNGVFDPGEGSMQIVEDFEMRSYGTLEINMTIAAGGSGDFVYTADAVVNNTNPALGRLPGDPTNNMGYIDPNYYNKVSFMGGGVVPAGAWVLLGSAVNPNTGLLQITNDNIVEVLDVDELGNPIVPLDEFGNPLVGTVQWHINSFAGYPFLLRADGIRIMTGADYALYGTDGAHLVNAEGQIYNYDENGNIVIVQDLSAVPVPAAVWLFGSGLIGLIGVARKRSNSK